MTFNSLGFLIFYPVVLLLYFVLPKKLTKYMLLIASYYFYLAWNYKLAGLIIFTTCVSYFCARIIEKTESKKVKKWCIVLTLISSLGVLFFFKYYNFLADSASFVFGLFTGMAHDWTLNLVLPVGISFYTFQTLSYAIDVYRGNEKCERDFITYALYVSFFPQLVAGPIERPGNLIPQLKVKNKFDKNNAEIGLQQMAIGFFKKIAVADLLAEYVNPVFNNASETTGMGVLIASVLFAVQIYCDFSGYSDIAIGCAKIMGINLMQNFNEPYRARSIKDFWNRWHISLSTWLRDYLYFPLGGSRCKKGRHLFNILIVFLASGLWHGANWTFVLWGLFHGIFRIVEELLKTPRAKLLEKLNIKEENKGLAVFETIITFIIICFSWIIFRANNISDLGVLLGKLFTSFGGFKETFTYMGLTLSGALCAVLSIAVIFMFDRLTVNKDRIYPDTITRKVNVVWCVWAVAVAWMLLLSVGGASTFIYFQF